MERDQREDHQNAAAPARKYLRLQEAGLSIFLSWPVAMMLLTMFSLDHIIGQVSIVMVLLAAIIFAIGTDGREKLKERKGHDS